MSTNTMSDPDLAEFDGAFADADGGSNSKGGRTEVPDGDYTAVIDKLEKRDSRFSPGVKQISWWLVIDGPTHAGMRLFRDTDIKAETMAIIKRDLRSVGFDLATFKMSEFSARAAEAIGRRVSVTKKKNARGYPQAYINGLADAPIPVDDTPF